MHSKIKQIKYFITILSISTLICVLFNEKAYARNAFVYCATNTGHWKWLNRKNVIVSGHWKKRKISYLVYQGYFVIDGGINAILDLQEQCIREFGADYKYAQPASNSFSGWYLFGDENGFIAEGIGVNYGLFIRI
ncbi:hypothetical protein [Fluviispira vulneris]|uniref:hypothetical protein n=1 Tax=Fluviispira vulneris TaxID=2763012 RepID=UPI0016445382|nr:hypothetical protein [Fluviispira vulneris]